MSNLKEIDHQIAIFNWWKEVCSNNSYFEKALFAVPNGGSRPNIAECVRLKKSGVRSGVPDMILAIPSGKYSALFIELKKFGGKPSESQIEYIKYLKKSGYCAFVVEGHLMAERLIYQYLNDPNSLSDINDVNIKYDQPVVIDEMVI